ncbi:GntR family transcriptional regulator [Nonlabens sp. YIK11]|uniref:FadR/GntR family transcriptional regulator n=1 Tax=Nonlabens sp. YIK11 TaxID=1453349 RepID=UPI0006DCB321|nr:FadR/GntR family transcriptional regulator [Nonlabens sp. YIK11]KQC34570.1 GntR family transcriptional regulator [Nonlabens sp. YIK11]
MRVDKFIINEKASIQKLIIADIKQLINNKNLEPGDKLPSERVLADKFRVPRNIVREAIQKLEFYGLVYSVPQSGTFVANIGVTAMNGMIDDIMDLETPDFKSLVETRILLELKTVCLAAKNRSQEELKNIKAAMEAYQEKVLNGESAVQEDLLFHLAIARASGNTTLRTLMLFITPGIITNFEKHHFCGKDQAIKDISQHEAIYKTIKEQDAVAANAMMKTHFLELYKYCNQNENNQN